MTRLLTISAIVLFLFSCKDRPFEPVPGEIIVTGRIINGDPGSEKVVRIDFTDLFADFSSKAQYVDENGEFRITYLAPYAAEFQVVYDKYIPVYAEPGDSIFLTLDAARIKTPDYLNSVLFSGDRAEINNSLWKGNEYIRYSISPIYHSQVPSDTLSVEEYYRVLDDKIGIFHDSISNYARENGFCREVENMLKMKLNFEISEYWAYEYNLPDHRWDDHSAAAYSARRKLYEYEGFHTFDPESFKYRYWSNHISSYISSFYLEYVGDDYYINDWSLPGCLKALEALKEKPAGFNRDYITAKLIMTDMDDIPIDSLSGMLDLILSPFIKEYISRSGNYTMPRFENIGIPGISYLTTEGEIEQVPSDSFIDYLSARYPGKVLYIDVWGTWCRACKSLFPASMRRKEEMKDKDVVFVYLCVTSKKEAWLKDIETFQLGGENYYLNDDASKLFTVHYQIDSYPRYMIIGKDGKVINNDAPHPNMKERFIEEIESCL